MARWQKHPTIERAQPKLAAPKYAQGFNIGTELTVKNTVTAQGLTQFEGTDLYPGQLRTTVYEFNPGDVGIVKGVMCPYVTYAYRKRGDHPYFLSVEFRGVRFVVSYKNAKAV